MGLEEGLEKLKSDIEGEVKKAEGSVKQTESEVVDKAKSTAIAEAIKELADKGISADDILKQISEKFSNVEPAKIKELIDKVFNKKNE